MIEKFVDSEFATNTYVLSSNDSCVIIDPNLEFSSDIIESIKKKYEIKGVLLTHAHVDHIDGVKNLKDYPIYISEVEYNYIDNNGYNLYGWYSSSLPFDKTKLDFRIVKDKDIINLLDEPIYVYLTPGHTLGGVTYIYKDKMFCGDTLFKNSIGRSDLSFGSESTLLKSIDFLLTNFNETIKIYPGHGDLTTVKDERNHNPFYLAYKKRK